MEKIYKSLKVAAVALVTLFGFSSCEDYLDKDADSNVSPETAFTNFTNMQGYVEEIYNCIPDKAKCYWTTAWNLGDDEIQNPQADGIIIHRIDLGDFYAWQNNDQFWFAANKAGLNPTSTDAFNHRLYRRGVQLHQGSALLLPWMVALRDDAVPWRSSLC